MNDKNRDDTIVSAKNKANDFVKNRMFDVLAASIIIAMLSLSLGVLELRTFDLKGFIDIVLETLPFYFANIMLNDNYYLKGVYAGKATTSFKSTVKIYSNKVNSLTGTQIGKLPEFCDKYNQKVLENLQLAVLRTEALTLEEFNVNYKIDGEDHGPLKAMSLHELEHLIGKHRAKAVITAKNITVKGISSNILLGNSNDVDATNLGLGEQEMHKKRAKGYMVSSFIYIVILMFIGAKNITEWGWVGIMFVVFKLLYIVTRSYMKYFDGYQDITIGLVNHVSRKSDILKEFESEYPSDVVVVETDESGNNQ